MSKYFRDQFNTLELFTLSLSFLLTFFTNEQFRALIWSAGTEGYLWFELLTGMALIASLSMFATGKLEKLKVTVMYAPLGILLAHILIFYEYIRLVSTGISAWVYLLIAYHCSLILFTIWSIEYRGFTFFREITNRHKVPLKIMALVCFYVIGLYLLSAYNVISFTSWVIPISISVAGSQFIAKNFRFLIPS